MPLTVDPRWRSFQAQLRKLAQTDSPAQRTVLRPVVKRVQAQVLTTGTAPDGSAQRRTKRGRPALVSRKIARTIRLGLIPGGVRGTSVIPWLEAHQRGHVFPARAGGGQKLTFGRTGRLLSGKRAARAKFVFDVIARPHRIGSRVLPPTPIYPESGTLTEPWAKAVNEGALEGMRAFVGQAAT